MPGHDIIVIGTSAGGLEVLLTIVRQLPSTLPASLFVVQHMPAQGQSLLPDILDRAGPLQAIQPTDGARIVPGQIYVAPPDHHLLVAHGHMRIMRGPKENSFRPAIDATFRTAAQAYGARVVGVILSGMLDDGTAGLLAIKRRGGVALVQAPAEAAYPSMPTSALRYVDVDAVLSAVDIPAMLTQLAAEPVSQKGDAIVSDRTALESNISGMDQGALQDASSLGTPFACSCPDCGGVLNVLYDGDLLRFRCQVGHAFSHESLLAAQADALDYQLWAAYRALDERITVARRLVEDAHRLNDATSERRFKQMIVQVEQQKEQIRLALMKEVLLDEPQSSQ